MTNLTHIWHQDGIEPRPYWWAVTVLTTTPSLLPHASITDHRYPIILLGSESNCESHSLAENTTQWPWVALQHELLDPASNFSLLYWRRIQEYTCHDEKEAINSNLPVVQWKDSFQHSSSDTYQTTKALHIMCCLGNSQKRSLFVVYSNFLWLQFYFSQTIGDRVQPQYLKLG